MTAANLADQFGMSLSEGEEFYSKYKKSLPTLFSWEDRTKRRCKREGTAYTYFGRPRRVAYYFQNGQAGFGYRTIINTIIQGSASDILKIAFMKLWKNVLNHESYREKVRFITTVHDEINYAVHKSVFTEVLPIIIDCMKFTTPEWKVDLEVEATIGMSWGDGFSIAYDEEKDCWVPNLV